MLLAHHTLLRRRRRLAGCILRVLFFNFWSFAVRYNFNVPKMVLRMPGIERNSFLQDYRAFADGIVISTLEVVFRQFV